MATKRRRSTTAAKRRTPTARRKTNPMTYASTTKSRRVARRRSITRRRNPATGSLLTQAAGLAAGITAVGLVQSFLPPIGGSSPVMVAARQAATGYLVGEGMQRFKILPAYATDMKLAGLALGVGTLINAWVLPTISGYLRPAPQAQPVPQGVNGTRYVRNGMGGIALLPDIPPSVVRVPPPAAAKQGMRGIAAMPSQFRR